MCALAVPFKPLTLSPRSARPNSVQSGQAASDESLIRAVADGDKRAMHTLYARHNVKVYRFIVRLTRNPTLAEDLLSEVFLDVWRQAATFRGKSQVSTWLLAIARNKTISALRRRCDDQLDEDTLVMAEDPRDNPEMVAENEDRGAIVQHCLARLSPNHREVLDLVYYHDKTVDETAEIIGIPLGTVKTRMFFARNKMRTLLAMAGVEAH